MPRREYGRNPFLTSLPSGVPGDTAKDITDAAEFAATLAVALCKNSHGVALKNRVGLDRL